MGEEAHLLAYAERTHNWLSIILPKQFVEIVQDKQFTTENILGRGGRLGTLFVRIWLTSIVECFHEHVHMESGSYGTDTNTQAQQTWNRVQSLVRFSRYCYFDSITGCNLQGLFVVQANCDFTPGALSVLAQQVIYCTFAYINLWINNYKNQIASTWYYRLESPPSQASSSSVSMTVLF